MSEYWTWLALPLGATAVVLCADLVWLYKKVYWKSYPRIVGQDLLFGVLLALRQVPTIYLTWVDNTSMWPAWYSPVFLRQVLCDAYAVPYLAICWCPRVYFLIHGKEFAERASPKARLLVGVALALTTAFFEVLQAVMVSRVMSRVSHGA